MRIPPQVQDFVQQYDTGRLQSHVDGLVDHREAQILINPNYRRDHQQLKFVDDLDKAIHAFESVDDLRAWLKGGNPDAISGNPRPLATDVATAFLYHKYTEFFAKWDNGADFLDSALGGRLSTAELDAAGGKDAFITELRATISDPYHLAMLEHAKFWPSFSDSDEFINAEATAQLDGGKPASAHGAAGIAPPTAKGPGLK